jgi:hypothetical protein
MMRSDGKVLIVIGLYLLALWALGWMLPIALLWWIQAPIVSDP